MKQVHDSGGVPRAAVRAESQKNWPVVKMQRKFPGLPRPVYATEARMDTETERYIPESSLLSDKGLTAAVNAQKVARPSKRGQAVSAKDEVRYALGAAIKAASEQ